jgi:hypothetical protein
MERHLHPRLLERELRDLMQDLHYAVRILRRAPASTAVAILTLVLGIAACITVFSWIDGLLWHPLPGTGDPDRLAMLESLTPNGYILTSWSGFRDYRDNVKQFSGLAVSTITLSNVGQETARAWSGASWPRATTSTCCGPEFISDTASCGRSAPTSPEAGRWW